jgi:pyruvate,water dikinase
MSSILIRVLEKDCGGISGSKAALSGLLESIDNIESADILASLRRIAREVLAVKPGAENLSPAQIGELIKADSGSLKAAHDEFIIRHGHRCIREAEMRSKSWKRDEKGLLENIHAVIRAEAARPANGNGNGIAGKTRYEETRKKVLEGKKGIARAGINFLIDQSRFDAWAREYTKSKFIIAADILKEAYLALAEKLVAAGALPDADLIYFLTHKEIGELIEKREGALLKKALRRRHLLDEQKKLKFKETYIGRPVPIEAQEAAGVKGDVHSGVSLSRGEASGSARVVRSPEDARDLQAGEIMVAACTDIGWSPYYSSISGLVTEVGSALSHGAVVAREYALPVVANIANATHLFRTGDYLNLNGTNGTVTIVESGS